MNKKNSFYVYTKFAHLFIIDTFQACVNSLNTCSRLKREQGNDGNGNDGNDGNDGNGYLVIQLDAKVDAKVDGVTAKRTV